MAERALTPTSHLVLGLVRMLEPCTSYEMKQQVSVSIGMFWSFPHSQLYAEPARLVTDGLLGEEQEESGRRRRLYRITEAGEAALDSWLGTPTDSLGELRDDGLLKLFFSDDADTASVAGLARSQARAHEERLAFLLDLREGLSDRARPAQLATLELGLRWDRTAAAFWNEIASHPPG